MPWDQVGRERLTAPHADRYWSPATGAGTDDPPLTFGHTITVDPSRHCVWNALIAL